MYLGAVIIVVLVNVLIPNTGQYVDIFQGLQALLEPFQRNTDISRHYDVTTRRSATRRHGDSHTYEEHSLRPINNYNLYSTTTKPSRKPARPTSSHNQPTTRKPNKQTTTSRQPWNNEDLNNYNNNLYSAAPNYNTNTNSNKNINRNTKINNVYSATNVEHNNRNPSNNHNNGPTTEGYSKPNNKVNDRRPINYLTETVDNRNDENSVGNNIGTKTNEPIRITSNRDVNVSAFITNNRVTTKPNTKPNLSTNNRERPNYNTFTTKQPLLSRPGVRPVPVDENRPPITNKPIIQVSNVGNQWSDTGTFTESPDTAPSIEIGPDEDDMTPAEKSRYIDLAESMCENYKALSVKKVVALPLVPSPEGIAVNVSDCTPLNIALIIGGKISTIEEFPHMALVGWMKIQRDGYSWKCGGSLISDLYVLTAGHCTYHEKDYNVISGPPHAVQLGTSLMDNPDALVVKVASVIRHPKYKMRRSYFDVALIKMTTRVTFSNAVRPACLGVPPRVGKPIIATGWGKTELGGEQSKELRSVSLPIWDMQDCRKKWGTSLKLPNGPTSESHVCAGERSGGKDTCQGDSGGPAQIQDGCAWRVVAITSYGRSCGAPQTPALYATIPRAFVAAQVFGKHRNTNNNQQKQDANNYGNQYQSNNGYVSQQQNNTGYGSQQQSNNGYGTQQQNNGYGSQQQNNNGYGSQQQNNNGYDSQQQNNNGYESQQQNNYGYGSQQQNVNKYVNQYGSQHLTNKVQTSQLYTSNLYDNQQPTNEYYVQQLNVNKYDNYQQNNKQSINKHNSPQQTDNRYEQNSNIYQQLSNKNSQQQTGQWNHRNENNGDEIPIGGWTVTNDKDQDDQVASSWNQQSHYNQDVNQFGTTSKPWWNR